MGEGANVSPTPTPGTEEGVAKGVYCGMCAHGGWGRFVVGVVGYCDYLGAVCGLGRGEREDRLLWEGCVQLPSFAALY